MSELNLDEMFTHIEVLKSREPEMNEHTVLKCPFNDMGQNSTEVKGDTPSGLLQTIAMKKYREAPIFEERKLDDGQFYCKYIMHGMTSEGVSNNKRNAKQLAARNLLLTIVDGGRHKEFLISGETANDARQFINSLATNLEADTEGWISKCNLLCQAKKKNFPQYECTEVTVESLKMFRCRAQFEEFVKFGMARTKKAAQNLACKEIYQEMVNRYGGLDRPERVQSSPVQNDCISDGVTLEQLVDYLNRVVDEQPPTSDKDYVDAKYEEALGVVSRFTHSDGTKLFGDCTFYDESQNNEFLVSLEVKHVLANRPSNMFGGKGTTEKAARENAAWQALRFIKLFGNIKPPPSDGC